MLGVGPEKQKAKANDGREAIGSWTGDEGNDGNWSQKQKAPRRARKIAKEGKHDAEETHSNKGHSLVATDGLCAPGKPK